ncbi:MAG: hypothetical protein ACRDPY_19120 [Streptosporangiaceae bacterium]
MGQWDAVIDVSNVCWSAELSPVGRRTPVWRRLELVMAAWRELHTERARFELVADDSLVRVLDDVRELRLLAASGALAIRPAADPLILSMARDRGLHVITRDHYVDHRLEHPWIEDEPGRFHRWQTVRGTVRIEPLDIRPHSPQTVSAAFEAKDLLRSRIDSRKPQHRRILQTRWQCANSFCPQAAQWQDQLLVWPLVTAGGEARCPSCDGPLRELGPRGPLHVIVVEDRASRAEIMRFPVEADCPVIVGRGSAVKGVNLEVYGTADDPAIMAVSRSHLLLRTEDAGQGKRRLAVTDLGSTNGTKVERWTEAGFGQPKPVPADKETIVFSRDRLILGGRIVLRLSGRHYAPGNRAAEWAPTPVPGSRSSITTVYQPG